MATRRERVILDLEDNFTSGIARAAVATRVLDEKLNHLGGTTRSTARDVDTGTKSVGRFGDGSNSAGPAIDKFSGRLKLLRDVALTLGPGLMPLGATAIPLLTAAMAGLGAAAGGIGVSVLALKGVGDALDSIDAYQLEPTTENLEAMRLEMEKMGPAGAHFVRFIDDLEPAMRELQMTARAGMLPGVEEGITALLDRLPMVRDIISELSQEMGELTSEAGAGLASDKWTPFFEYVRTEARPTLDDFAQSVGNVAEGVANMLVAFAPLTGDVTGGLEEMTAAFAEWSRGLGENDSFQEFLSYIQQNGPAAMDLLGALASAFGSFVAAVAPVGQAVLPILTALVEVFGALAASPLGTMFFTLVAATTAWSRAATIAAAASTKLGIGLGQTAAGAAAARASMAAMATTTAAAALGIGSVVDAMSIWDSRQRSGDAASAMVRNIEELNAALTASNVGKWATDLGIDINKLSTDLVVNGRNGEYVSQVMAQLAADSHGVGAAINSLAGNVMPFWTAGADKAYDANKDLTEIIQLLGGQTRVYESDVVAAALANDALAGASRRSGQEARKQARALNEATQAMRDQRDAALAAFDAETQWRQALKDSAQQAKKSNDGIRGMSDAVIENRRQLGSLAAAWNNQDAAVKNNMGRFREARQAFIDTATAMGVPRAAARELARELLELPRSKTIKVEADTGQALENIQTLNRALSKIVSKTITITARRAGDALGGFSFGNPGGDAAGGYIRGPGTTTSDSIPALLSDREYVIRAKSVDKYGVAMMHAINAGQFAGGGQAGAQSGQDWSAVDGVVSGLMGLRRALRESERALAAETARRDELRAKAAEVSSGITSGLQSDIWAGPSNVWAAGAQRYNPIAALNMQRDRARRMIATINTLRAKGLTGAALAAILGEGLEAAEFMASQAPDMLGTYTAAYAESEAAVAQAAQLGGQATYGGAADKLEPGIRELNRSVKDLQRQLDRISGVHKGEGRKNAKDNADFVAAAINGAAKNGKQKAHR